jgi:hypothetical protein
MSPNKREEFQNFATSMPWSGGIYCKSIQPDMWGKRSSKEPRGVTRIITRNMTIIRETQDNR